MDSSFHRVCDADTEVPSILGHEPFMARTIDEVSHLMPNRAAAATAMQGRINGEHTLLDVPVPADSVVVGPDTALGVVYEPKTCRLAPPTARDKCGVSLHLPLATANVGLPEPLCYLEVSPNMRGFCGVCNCWHGERLERQDDEQPSCYP